MTKSVASVDRSSGGTVLVFRRLFQIKPCKKRQLERVSKCISDRVFAGHTGKVTPFNLNKQSSLLNLIPFLKL